MEVARLSLHRALLASGLFALAVGCSQDPAPESPVFERVVLEFEGESPAPPESLPIRTWSIFGEGKDQADWNIQADQSDLLKRGKDTLVAIHHQKKIATIEVPVSFAMGRAVALTIKAADAGDGVKVSATLYAGEAAVASSQGRLKPNPAGKGCQVVLAHEPGTPTDVDRLVLKLTKGSEPLLLKSLSLQSIPLGLSLGPKPYSSATLVEIQGDTRRARALPTGQNYGGRLFVEGVADVLRFTYGQTELTMTAGQVPQIRVQLNERGAQPGDAIEKIFGFGNGQDPKAGWFDAEIPLGDWAGKELEVNFSLHADGADGVCLLGEPRRSSLEALPKTVVFVTSDTHRSDHLGFLMPDGSLKTDALDRLAAEGATYLDALSSVNNTTPSHVSLMTGLSPRDTGLVVNAKRLAEDAPTLAEAFREHGYATLASVSATPVIHKLSNLGQGFDRYAVPLGEPVHDAEDALAHIHDWLADYEGEPVFVWVHIYDAHGPYDAPDPFKTHYYEEGRDPFDVHGPDADPKLAPYWDRTIADPTYTESLYKGEITYLDTELGRLFDLPRVQSGIVAVTADHGEVLRFGPDEPFDHRGLCMNTLAVPLILKAPGISPGTQRSEPVSHLDIGRTLLNLAGFPEAQFPGRDLVDSSPVPGEARFAMEGSGLSAAMITDKWFFNLTLRPLTFDGVAAPELLHSVRLYDLEADPACRVNVWEENLETTTAMRLSLLEWLHSADNHHWQDWQQELSEEVTRELASLGYTSLEDEEPAGWFDETCACDWCGTFEK